MGIVGGLVVVPGGKNFACATYLPVLQCLLVDCSIVIRRMAREGSSLSCACVQ